MAKLLKFDPTTPVGRPSLSISFTRTLPTGVTVATVTSICAVHPNSALPDAGAAGRLEATPVVQVDGVTVSQFFSGGVAGVDYIVTFKAVYSDGEIEPVDAIIQCRSYIDVGTPAP